MAYPEWATRFRRPGTELRRCSDNRYSLYECSCVYDKQRKRPRKITGKYLGSITEDGGFKPSDKRSLERRLEEALESGGSSEVAALSAEVERLRAALRERDKEVDSLARRVERADKKAETAKQELREAKRELRAIKKNGRGERAS